MCVGRAKAPIQLHITSTTPAMSTKLLSPDPTIRAHRALFETNLRKALQNGRYVMPLSSCIALGGRQPRAADDAWDGPRALLM